jgi:hypothetical protein
MNDSSTQNGALHETASLASRARSVPGRALRRAVRRVKGLKKQTLRGVKLAQYLLRRVRTGQKSLYFRLRDSETGRTFLNAAIRARAPRAIRQRRQIAAPYLAQLNPVKVATIDRERGYCLFSMDPAGEFREVLAACRGLFERKKAEIDAHLAGFESWSPERQGKYLSRKQSFLRYLLDDEDLRRHPEVVEFALSDTALGAATRYFGMVPYLSRVDLMYSLPRGTDDNISSQLFHLDHEGVTQVKLFVHVFDVNEPEGPFTFIPADATARIVNEIRKLRRQRRSGHDIESRRYSDEEIAAVGGRDAIVAAKGRAGTGVAVDTSRCLHLGSRVHPGTFRLCLYLQYCTTRELTNVFDVDRYRHDPVRYLAVNHSIEPGRAKATDYTHEIMAG